MKTFYSSNDLHFYKVTNSKIIQVCYNEITIENTSIQEVSKNVLANSIKSMNTKPCQESDYENAFIWALQYLRK